MNKIRIINSHPRYLRPAFDEMTSIDELHHLPKSSATSRMQPLAPKKFTFLESVPRDRNDQIYQHFLRLAEAFKNKTLRDSAQYEFKAYGDWKFTDLDTGEEWRIRPENDGCIAGVTGLVAFPVPM